MKNKILFRACSIVIMIAIFASCLSMIGFARADMKMSVQAASAEVDTKNGGTVDVPVNVSGNVGFISAIFKVAYNSTYFTLDKVTVGKDFSKMTNASQEISTAKPAANPYTVSLEGDTLDADITANSTLVTLTFKIKAGTPEGKYDVTISDAEFVNYGLKTVSVATENNVVTTTEAFTMSFPDVTDETAWYYAPIAYAVKNNIFSGYASGPYKGYFGLSDNIQRQDFMVTLAKYSKEDYNAFAGGGKFSDVDPAGYYAGAVNWGVSKSIVSGYQNGTFGVGDNVTREQLVLFFYRYAKYKGYNVSVTTNAAYWQKKYSDFNTVSDWAQDAVIWALEKGVISGKQGLYVDPQGNAERCQVAVIFYNIDSKGIFKMPV